MMSYLESIPRFLTGRRKPTVGKHSSYSVTPLGKTKAEQCALTGPSFSVLSHIAEEGPCSMAELERECNMPNEKVRAVLRALMHEGYVRPTSQGE